MVKIVAISDIHGELIEVPPCDIFIIAGDICPTRRETLHECLVNQERWLKNEFLPWLKKIPARHKVFIAGNHDWIFELSKDALPDFSPAIYLENSGVEIEGIHIWGSPYSPFFCGWSFNFPEYDRKVGKVSAACWAQIPENTDILVTHGPPKGYGDITYHGGRNHYGDNELLKALKRVKPKVHFFGHFHEGCEGEDTIMKLKYPDGTFTYCCNVSVVNENYIRTKPCTVLEI